MNSSRAGTVPFISLFELLCLVCTMWSVKKGKNKWGKKSFGDIWFWSLSPIWAKERREEWEKSSNLQRNSSGFLFFNLSLLPRVDRRRFCALTFGSFSLKFSLRWNKLPFFKREWENSRKRPPRGIFSSGSWGYFICPPKVGEFCGHSWSWEESERRLSYTCLSFSTKKTAAWILAKQVVFSGP